MKRRDFIAKLSGSLYLIWLSGLALSGCGSNEDEELEDLGNFGGSQTQQQSQTLTSSMAGGHSHQILVKCADLEGNRAFTLPTSMAGGHSHKISLSNSHLTALRQGQIVRITTTSAGGHTHQFQIMAC